MKLRGEAIPRNKKVKYLGVGIDDELKWNEHIMAVRRRCLRGLDKLRRLRKVLPVSIKKLYNTLALPQPTTVVFCGKSAKWNCSRSWNECRTMERDLSYLSHLGHQVKSCKEI